MPSHRLLLQAASLIALAACRSSAPATEGAESASAPAAEPASSFISEADYKSIAAKIVRQSAGVAKGDIVQLAGNSGDLPLLEELGVEVLKLGAEPIILVSSEDFGRRSYDEVPAEFDSRTPKSSVALAKLTDVFIVLESGQGSTYNGVSPERQAARARAMQPVMDAARQRGMRVVSLGNGLYPTPERAEQLGISEADLEQIMLGGLDTDYPALQATGERLRRALVKGDKIRVTGPSGTDLRLGVKGRPVLVSDGVISPEDRKQGGSALSVWLPAGEVYLIAVPGSAEGVIVADRYSFQGEQVEGLRIEVKGGKVTGMTAKSGLAGLQARYAAAGPGKEKVGILDFGINPGIRIPEGKAVEGWSRAGAVTIGVGSDEWAGGKNVTDFSVAPEVLSATVTLDGVELVKNGALVAAPAVASR